MTEPARLRLRTAIAFAVVVPFGFWVRFYEGPWGFWISNWGGGIAYEIFFVLLVFWIVPRPQWAGRIAAAVCVATCALEFLQLWVRAGITSHFGIPSAAHLWPIGEPRNPRSSAATPPVSELADRPDLNHIWAPKWEVIPARTLWHPAPLEALRATFLGAALLGSNFFWSDLPIYPVGCLAGWGVLRRLAGRGPGR